MPYRSTPAPCSCASLRARGHIFSSGIPKKRKEGFCKSLDAGRKRRLFRWRGSCTSFARPASWNMSSACCAGTPSSRAYARMTRASSRDTSNGRPLILDSPDFDLKRALDQQIELLELRRERIGNLTDMAKALRGERGTPWNSSRSTRASWTYTPSRRRRRGARPRNGGNTRRSGPAGRKGSRSRRSGPSSLRTATPAPTRSWRGWARPHSACGGLPPMSRIVGVNNVMAHNS